VRPRSNQQQFLHLNLLLLLLLLIYSHHNDALLSYLFITIYLLIYYLFVFPTYMDLLFRRQQSGDVRWTQRV